MANVQFFPIDINYVEEGNRVVIRIFGRTVDGKRIVVFDDSLEPYFWVIPKRGVDIEGIRKKIELIREGEFYVVKAEVHNKNCLNEELKAVKVIVNKPDAISIIKDVLKEAHEIEAKKEIDINFYKRYLIDKKIFSLALCEVNGEAIKTNFDVDFAIKGIVKQIGEEILKPNALAFDIETYNRRGYSSSEIDKIAMISFFGENFRKVLVYGKVDDKEYIENVEDEEHLLKRFKEVITDYKPDYLISYFGDGFDFPYIKERADKYGIKLSLNVDKSNIKVGKAGAKIIGIAHLDILNFIRDVIGNILGVDSFDLSTVSKVLINEKKDDAEIEEMSMDKDLGKYCEYCLKDSELTYKIFNKILPNIEELVKLIGMPIYDICRMSYGNLVENYILRKAFELNELVQNKPQHEAIRKRRMNTYKGAFVFEPKPGFYKNLVVFDFRGLYSSIIVAHNICLSTLTNESTNAYKSPEIEVGNKKVRYYFNYKREGFIPRIVKELIERRIRVKEILRKERDNVHLKARDYALKTILNSFYGYFGFFAARYYCLECAASITAFGRDYILKTIKKAEDAGFNVIFSDTDSVCIALDNKTNEDALNFMEEVNKELPSLMEFELEDFYPKGIFVMKKAEVKGAKKKYALIDRNGKIKVRGFETIRRNWSYVARELQDKILSMILKDEDINGAFEHVREVIEKIKKREIPIEKMIIKTQLRKDLDEYEQIGPHVAVARRMKEMGLDVEAGVTIKFIVVEGKGMIRDRARLINEVRREEYDPEYYINNQIIPAVERIFDVLGFKKEDLFKEQSKLSEFK